MLNITKVERRVFKRHFISNAFVELRFENLDVNWIKLEPIFKQLVTDKLSLSISRRSISTELKITPAEKTPENAAINSLTQVVGLIAQNKDNTYSIQVLSDRIIFATQKYPGFISFLHEIELGVSVLSELLGIKEYVWAGVRKVNEILATSEVGAGYSGQGLNRQLATPMVEGVFKPESLVLASSRYELLENSVRCIIDTNVSRLNEQEYILKLDLDLNQAFEKSNLETTKAIILKLNEKLFQLFMWAVSDDVITSLEVG